MKLSEYIAQFPRNERAAVREAIAKKCDVSPVTVKSWQNESRNIKPEHFEFLTPATGGQVTIFDYYPGLSAA